jgi:putative nucleotidyltransferase with HDIG domain
LIAGPALGRSEEGPVQRLLFVDDEPRVLDSLRRQLASRRAEWELHFATSGEAALDTLARAEFDAIVTDIRMPGMDGATLLEEVRRRCPGTFRVVLSGHCETGMASRALAAAHRYLSKPCDTDTLKETLDRGLELRAALNEPGLRSLLHRAGDLPHPPEICGELERALADPEPSFEDIGAIVSRDPGLVARVLQFANSAYFAGTEQTSGIDAAIARLGTTVLSSLVVSTLIRDRFAPGKLVEGFSIRAEQRHAMLAAAIAREIARPYGFGDHAFTAALLHDVGKLVLASRLPDEYATTLVKADRGGLPLPQVEADTLGVSHAQVGAYLLALWGLPIDLILAVKVHHNPPKTFPETLNATAVVVIANHLAHTRVEGDGRPLPAPDARWQDWQRIAASAGGRS